MFSRTTVRRWTLVAAAGLAGVLAAAALAFADGEDDPNFGVGGTAYPFLLTLNGPSAPHGTPLTAVGPDGRIAVAGGVFALQRGRSAPLLPATGFLVMRVTSTGQRDGTFGIDGVRGVETPAGRPLMLDLDVEPDGTIVGAGTVDEIPTETETVPATNAGRVLVENPEDIRVFRFAPDGTLEGQTVIPPPGGCREARAAQIAGAVVYGLWGECDGPDRVSRHDLGSEGDGWTATLDSDLTGVDLALGPDGDLHVLTAEDTFGGSRDFDATSNTVILRFSPDGTLDPTYGGSAHRLDGAPIDFDVDGAGRTIAWVRQINLRRDESGNWEFRRLDADGAPDMSWGGGNYAALGGPEFGPTTLPFDDCVFENVDGCRVWQIKAQPDGKVIATGPSVLPPIPDRQAAQYGREWSVARMRADGERDGGWGTNGVRVLTFGPVVGGDPFFHYVGQPALQPDGKVLIPFLAVRRTPNVRVQPPEGFGAAYGVQRLGTAPPQQTTTQVQQQGTTTQQAPPAPVQAAAPSAAPARVCKSRRRFTIRLRTGRRKAERSPIVTASVKVNGKSVTVSRRARRTARVVLTNLPKGRFTVSIRLRLADGGIVRETRRYRTCAKKIERELKPLRTHPPRR